jgi:hypothetical protein
MASFFQPGSNDPAIEDCETGRFQVYCNSILASESRLQTWYQIFNLALGSAAVFVPLLYMLYHLAAWLATSKSWRLSRYELPKFLFYFMLFLRFV